MGALLFGNMCGALALAVSSATEAGNAWPRLTLVAGTIGSGGWLLGMTAITFWQPVAASEALVTALLLQVGLSLLLGVHGDPERRRPRLAFGIVGVIMVVLFFSNLRPFSSAPKTLTAAFDGVAAIRFPLPRGPGEEHAAWWLSRLGLVLAAWTVAWCAGLLARVWRSWKAPQPVSMDVVPCPK